MSAQNSLIKKQIKQLAKNLKNKMEVNKSLEALYELKASLDLYERYEIRSLVKQFSEIADFAGNATQLRTFLKQLRQQRKQDEKMSTVKNEDKENRKRPSTPALDNVSKKMSVSTPIVMAFKKPEQKRVEMKKISNLEEQNNALINTNDVMFQRRKNESKIYSGRKRESDEKGGNSDFLKPSQILRSLSEVSFEKIRPVFEKCTSNEKLKFIKKNSRFVNEVEETFKELTISEFPGITKLPNQFQHWYQFYEALTKMHRNEEVSKLEELSARIAENRKKAENVRKTKIIDTVHSGSSRRPTLVAQRPLNNKRSQ